MPEAVPAPVRPVRPGSSRARSAVLALAVIALVGVVSLNLADRNHPEVATPLAALSPSTGEVVASAVAVGVLYLVVFAAHRWYVRLRG